MPNVLPRLPAVRELVKMYGLSARSQLGQNFILDKNITDKITVSAGVSSADALVVEVGPGPGLLTRSILEKGAKNVVAVEKDVRFLPTLTQLAEASEDRLKILSGDILKIPHSDILNAAKISTSPLISSTSTINYSDNIHIIGNLPFNVASPLLLRFLHMHSRREGLFGVGNVQMTLMFQEEVGQRLAANVGTKHRGRLSVMAQSLCDVRIVYEVPSSVFVPIPKVNASLIHFVPRADSTLDAEVYKKLEDVLRYFFTKRRKTIGNIFGKLAKDVPSTAPLLPALLVSGTYIREQRPEDLTNDQYNEIARWIQERGIDIPLS